MLFDFSNNDVTTVRIRGIHKIYRKPVRKAVDAGKLPSMPNDSNTAENAGITNIPYIPRAMPHKIATVARIPEMMIAVRVGVVLPVVIEVCLVRLRANSKWKEW
jgi:hypothetical protein